MDDVLIVALALDNHPRRQRANCQARLATDAHDSIFGNTALDEFGRVLNILLCGHPLRIFNIVEATGEIINSPHHGGNPAFVIGSANVVSEATLGHVK